LFGNNASTSCSLSDASTCAHDRVARVDRDDVPDAPPVLALYDALLYVLVMVSAVVVMESMASCAAHPTGSSSSS